MAYTYSETYTELKDMQEERDSLDSRLETAEDEGDTDWADSIKEEIADLDAAAAELIEEIESTIE